jgi:pSer/pThr/pTyr-binding forkhead associated (FHA) protein
VVDRDATTADVAQVRARLTLINPDGTAGGVVALMDGEATLGRVASLPLFAEDPFVSPRHLRVTCTAGRALIEDLGSVNGTFLQLGLNPCALEHGDVLRIGQQLLRFESLEAQAPVIASSPDDGARPLGGPPPPAAWGVLCRIVSAEGDVTDRYMLAGAEQVIGRERGDIVFPLDGFASGQHARLTAAPDGAVKVHDLGSSNGTYLRLRAAYEARDGDLFLIGQRVFQLHIHDPT